MSIILSGINHKTCPVEIRERLSFAPEEIQQFLSLLKEDPLIEEAILLSTCNRTECYLLAKEDLPAREKALEYLYRKKSVTSQEFRVYTYFMKDMDVIEHLFSVASGIDSMIIGEGQILRQIKEAYRMAMDIGSINNVMGRLFRSAITCGKRARSETEIGTGASSVSLAAIEFAKMLFGDLSGKTTMIIGAGKMAQIAAKHLSRYNLKQVIVANRDFRKACEMAVLFKGEAINFDKVEDYLSRVDIVISSTGAPHYVVYFDTIKRAIKKRHNRPLFLIDIAVPRDIEPSINKLPNVFLYDIDDLQEAVKSTLNKRRDEIDKVKDIINTEKDKFIFWYRSRKAVPLIKSIKKRAEKIRKDELSVVIPKLSHLPASDMKIIDNTTKKMINKLLHSTIIRLKEVSSSRKTDLNLVELIGELFDVD